MPHLTKSVPAYRKHKASGQAFVELNGRRHYLGPYGTKASKLEYDRFIGEWLVNGRKPAETAEATDAFTVVELCARYWKYASVYYRKDGRPTRLQHVKRAIQLVRDLYGREPANDFKPLKLKAVQQVLIGKGLSRNYINGLVDIIRAMFRWGVSEEICNEDVHRKLATVDALHKGRSEAREPDPILPVDDATVDATLPHLPQVVADMVSLQLLTGARPAEICILRPCDLDRSGAVWLYKPSSHKTAHKGKGRTVFIGERGQAILLRYLARDPEAYCFSPRDSEAKRRAAQHAARKVPLSSGNKPGTNRVRKPRRTAGDRYDTCAYRRAIHRACDRAFPAPEGTNGEALKAWQAEHRWSPNRLRHAAATKIRQEFGIEYAQVALGHASISTTEIYAEIDRAKGCEVAKAIG